jgi:hypothetical protein
VEGFQPWVETLQQQQLVDPTGQIQQNTMGRLLPVNSTHLDPEVRHCGRVVFVPVGEGIETNV